MDKTEKTTFSSIEKLCRRKKDGTFSEIWEDWRWILSYSRRYWKQILLYTVLGVLSATLSLVSSVATKYTIDIITGFQTDRLGVLIGIMVGGGLVSLLFDSLTSRLSARLSVTIHNDIQADVFDKIVDADWMALGKFSNGDLLSRMSSDISCVSGNAISWLPSLIIAVYRFVATLMVLLYYDWVMAAIAFATAPFLLLISRVLIKKQREHGVLVRQTNSQIMTFEAESFYNFDTIKSFGAAPLYSRKLRKWQEQYKDVSLNYNLFSIKTNVLMSVLNILVQFAAFGYCLFRLWTGDITYGTMTLFLQQRSSLSSTFHSVISIIPAFLTSSVAAHRIRELTQLPRERHGQPEASWEHWAREGFTVQMEELDFSYVENDRVIENSSLEARPGQIVALVGASGEG